jgi:PAS domain S-box-containing protein
MSRFQNLDVDQALRLIVEGTASETGTGPDNVAQLFPNDPDLKAFSAVSYLGVPLRDENGVVLGHLAILDSNPLPADPRLLTFFHIFAVRAVAEHRRLRAEEKLREREEKLTRLITSALDGILELDHDLNITLGNQAAAEIFASSQAELVGSNFQKLLTEKSVAILEDVLSQLKSSLDQRQHVWIPAGLEAIQTGGQTVPLEATLSLSTPNERQFYTVILRNVNERHEAMRRIAQLTEQTEYLKDELKSVHNCDEIISASEVMNNLLRDVARVAVTAASVLILGETGTGKELIARAIHNASKRRDKPLVKVNCAALPATLIESELFGHERGSFTGATAKRIGRFQLADQGTIFLDEVGELPLELQAKLLRVLQEGEFEPVGSCKTTKIDVRVIAATNRDLEKQVSEGRFREDLYYRLSVFPLKVPPLRKRKEDIVPLAQVFLARSLQKLGRTIEPLKPDAIARLNAYDWPGNVREMQNVIERAVIVADGRGLNLDRALPAAAVEAPVTRVNDRVLTVAELQELEKNNILSALKTCGWRIAGDDGAAKLLGMKPSTLNSRISALGLKRPHVSL